MIKVNELYLTEYTVIKILEAGKTSSYGFDLATEKLVQVDNTSLIKMPGGVKKIIQCERLRYFIARDMCDHKSKIGQTLGMRERTGYRLSHKYDINND